MNSQTVAAHPREITESPHTIHSPTRTCTCAQVTALHAQQQRAAALHEAAASGVLSAELQVPHPQPQPHKSHTSDQHSSVCLSRLYTFIEIHRPMLFPVSSRFRLPILLFTPRIQFLVFFCPPPTRSCLISQPPSSCRRSCASCNMCCLRHQHPAALPPTTPQQSTAH